MIHKNNDLALVRGIYSNIGDLAILSGTLRAFKFLKINPRYIFDPEPLFPENFFNILNIKPIYTLPSLIEQNIQKNKSMINPLNYIMPTIMFPKELYTLRKNYRNIGCLFHIGGSRFGGKFAINVFGEICNAYYKKKVLDSKLIIGGVSIEYGNVNSYYGKIYKNFINNVDHILVRDDMSISNLKRFKISDKKYSLICDFAFWLEPIKTQNTIKIKKFINEESNGKLSIGISLRMLAKKEYFNCIFKLIKQLDSKGFSIFFIPTSNNCYCMESHHDQDDYNLCSKINSIFKMNIPIIQTKNLSPEEIIEILSALDAIISIRVHGAIFGTLANLPTIHIYYDKKGLSLFKTFFNDTVPLFSIDEFIDNYHIILESLEKLFQERRMCNEIIKIEKRKSLKIIRDVFSESGIL